MFKNICFFLQTPLTKRDYERFGIEILRNRGFKVYFLDITSILHPEYLNNYKMIDKMPLENIIECNDRSDIVKYFKYNNDFLGISIFGIQYETLFFYRLLHKYNIPYIILSSSGMPLPMPSKRIRFHLVKRLISGIKNILKLNRSYINNLIYCSMRLLPNTIFKFQPPLLIVARGNKSIPEVPKSSKQTKLIFAHTFDYDLYLKYKNNNSQCGIKGKFAVFLDEYYPFHPDFFLRNGHKNPFPDHKTYYKKLNNFFSFFENKMNMPVVIAAHPRSNYEGKQDFFQGRRVLKGKTMNLVANSECVLMHSSTAVNFAVLYKKPKIFITFDELKNTPQEKFIEAFAREFDKKPINISQKIEYDIDKEFISNDELDKRYIDNYIKAKGSPDKYSWDIIADEVSKYN